MKTYFVNGESIKNIELSQYPPEAWHFYSGEPDVKMTPDLYATVAAVFRAANLSASAIANLPFALIKSGGKKTEDDYDNSDGWQNKIGFMPKPRELLRLIRLSLFMDNKAYLFGERNNGRITSLRYIVPSTIEPMVDEVKGLIGFKRKIGTKTTEYPLNDNCPITYLWWLDHTTELLPSKNSEFRALMAAGDALFYADYYVTHFFKRGGIKPTMLMVEGVATQENREKIEKIWDKLIHGAWKYLGKVFNAEAIKPVVIGEGIDNLKDTDLYESKITDIALASGIPRTLLLANSANYATAQTEYIQWFRDSVIPWADWIADELTQQVFSQLGLRLEFRPEMTDPGQEDEVKRAGAYRAYVSTGMKPSVAAQVVGIELPPGIEYEDLDEDEEPQPTTDEPITEQPLLIAETPTPVRFIPTMEQYRELTLWQNIAVKRTQRGDEFDPYQFQEEVLPAQIADVIRGRLAASTDLENVKAAFTIDDIPYSEPDVSPALMELAVAINRYVDMEQTPDDYLFKVVDAYPTLESTDVS